MENNSQSDVDEFKTGWGQCIISDEEIHIEQDFKMAIKRRYEGNRPFILLIGGMLLYLVLSLIINRWIFSRIFAVFVFGTVIPILLLLIVYGAIVGQKKNTIDDSVIPLSAVEYVRFTDRPSNGLDIVCVKNGTEYVAFVPFAESWYSWMDEAMETAQTVFERRDIPIHEE